MAEDAAEEYGSGEFISEEVEESLEEDEGDQSATGQDAKNTKKVTIEVDAELGQETPKNRGTAFLRPEDLPEAKDEEEEDQEQKEARLSVANDEEHGAEEVHRRSSPARKGTTFLRPSDVPADEDQDEDEEQTEDMPAKRSVSIAAEGDDHEERKMGRKGTAFLRPSDLPHDDEEEEDEEQKQEQPAKKSVSMAVEDDHQERKMGRKGTAFLRPSDVPADEEEEDEEEEGGDERPAKKSVSIDAEDGQEMRKTSLKGTAFLSPSEIPLDDEEEEDGSKERKTGRKDTAFLRGSDLPVDDEEDDEDDAEQDGEGPTRKSVSMDVEDGHKEKKKCRKGTTFLDPSDLPIDDEQDEQDEEAQTKKKSVTIDAEDGAEERSIARKGTAFLGALDPPPDDEEDEQDEEGAHEEGSHEERQRARKGTAFLQPSDLPFDDEEEEEQDEEGPTPKSVSIDAEDGHGPKRRERKGTTFLRASELPADDEEENEEQDDEGPTRKSVSIDAEGDHEERRSVRHGTTFLRPSDLPDDAEEDEEQAEEGRVHKSASIDAGSDHETRKIDRKGTAFVNPSNIPSDDDPEEEKSERCEEPAEEQEQAAEEEEELSRSEILARFEGRGDAIEKSRKKKAQGKGGVRREKGSEVHKFLTKLKEKGGGKITVAWRRFFDSDGDGELDFPEFCTALTAFSWYGDVLKLWKDLAGGSPSLSLEVVDPDGAAILQAFESWCSDTMGGPTEVFKAIDDDGSDSLTADEFAEGLAALGFFDHPDLEAGMKEMIGNQELVLENLWPLLDQNGRGCVTADQLLFLEKDPDKKERVRQELLRIRRFGATPEQVISASGKMIHKLVMQTTALGNRHWSQLRDGHIGVGRPVRMQENLQASIGSQQKEPRRLKRNVSEPSAIDMSFLEALGSTKGSSMASPAGALPRLRLHRPSSSQLLRQKVDRNKSNMRRQCYGSGFSPPLPDMIWKSYKEAKASGGLESATSKAGTLTLSSSTGEPSSSLPSVSVSVVRRKKSAPASGFNPMRSQDFLSAGRQDALLQHYFE